MAAGSVWPWAGCTLLQDQPPAPVALLCSGILCASLFQLCGEAGARCCRLVSGQPASPARGSARSEEKVLIHPERLWMDRQRAGACPGSLCGGELLEQMVGIPRVRGWPAPGRCWLCASGRRMGAAACRLTQTHRRLCWNWLDYSMIQRAHPINFLGFFYSSLILTHKTLSVEQIYT